MFGALPPFVKALTTKTSPSECRPLNEPFAFRLTGLWKNQKPTFASPLVSNRSAPKLTIV